MTDPRRSPATALAFVWKSRWAISQMLLVESAKSAYSPEAYAAELAYYQREYERAERGRRLAWFFYLRRTTIGERDD